MSFFIYIIEVYMKKIFLIAVLLLFPFCVNAAEIGLAKDAKSAIIIEASTGDIIFEKDADIKLAPASMTKMMSMLLIAESIEKGVINWDDMVTISKNASSMGGSQILLETGENMKVEDLFKGIAIASGNDAVVALAEKVAGTEEAFVSMMNKKAYELGLSNTNFKNPHGLDEINHYSSARDMSKIARELVKHEEVLKYTKIYETYLRANLPSKIWLVNTNKLVRFYNGADGLKTGYTKDAGYCLTATAKRDNMRLIAVVMGELSADTRNEEVMEMLDYGFAQYKIDHLLTKNDVLGKVEVLTSQKRYIDLVPSEDITFLNKKISNKRDITYKYKIDEIKVPLKKGDIVGDIYVYEDNNVIRKEKLTIKEDINKISFIKLLFRNLKDIVVGNFNV